MSFLNVVEKWMQFRCKQLLYITNSFIFKRFMSLGGITWHWEAMHPPTFLDGSDHKGVYPKPMDQHSSSSVPRPEYHGVCQLLDPFRSTVHSWVASNPQSTHRSHQNNHPLVDHIDTPLHHIKHPLLGPIRSDIHSYITSRQIPTLRSHQNIPHHYVTSDQPSTHILYQIKNALLDHIKTATHFLSHTINPLAFDHIKLNIRSWITSKQPSTLRCHHINAHSLLNLKR